MDNRDLLATAAAVAIGLVVLIAVLAAGYMLVSSLFGGARPTPTPTYVPSSIPSSTMPAHVPANATPTPNVTIPSGPAIHTETPYASATAYPVVPTPVRPVVKSAELVGNGTDKTTYNRGDTATVYITIKNTGTVTIDEAKLHVTVARYVSMIGYVNVQNADQTLDSLNIQPGETKKAEYAITIPSEYQGMSTAGKYKFTVDVTVWDNDIGTFTEEVEVQ